MRYRLSQAELENYFVEVPSGLAPVPGFRPEQDLESVLNQVSLFGMFNHQSGVFARAETLWNQQSNHGYEPDRAGDDFWQINLFLGYRFPNRRAEIKLGLLNVTDQDYRLNPLNLNPEFPRERMLLASLRFNL